MQQTLNKSPQKLSTQREKMLKVEVISTEMIKPSSPTPLHLHNFKFSLLDQLAPFSYFPVFLFYTTNNSIEVYEKLKRTLSEAISFFYPLAGRMKEDDTIDCNDEGAEFSYARVNGQLSEFLKQPHMEVLNQLLPYHLLQARTGADVPLAVQVNAFDCGGVAIGVQLSHKVADGVALSSFLTKWAALARSVNEAMEDVALVSDSVFPPRPSVPTYNYAIGENVVTKRLLFNASAIAALRTTATSHGSKPTRIEAVSALIWRCCIKAYHNKNPKGVSVITHAVNLRRRMVPQLPDSYFGNLWATAVTKGVKISDCKGNMHGCLEAQIKDAISEIDVDFMEELKGTDGALKAHQKIKTVVEKYIRSGIHFCIFTSWCGFPFYDADFGWGKPIWISSCNVPVKNLTLLFGTKGGDGIEAWMNMEADEMAKFEQDQELLSFATIS